MDLVEFLLTVVNMLLALVVLFGGRLIFQRLTALREELDVLKNDVSDEKPPLQRDAGAKPLEWRE